MASGHQLQNAEASSDANRHVSAEGLAKRCQNPVEWGSALNLDHVQTILSEELCLESSHFQEGQKFHAPNRSDVGASQGDPFRIRSTPTYA